MAKKTKLSLVQGKTFNNVYRWAAAPFIYVPITGVALQAPVRITAPNHELPDGWPVAPVSIVGTKELNSPNGGDDYDTDYKRVTVIDADTVELNTVNAAGFTQYVSGGYLKALTPVDLSGYSARMKIKSKSGTELASFTSDDGDFIINNTTKTITLKITAAEVATFSVDSFKGAQYEIEMYNLTGDVYRIAYGEVVLEKEVTT